MQPLKVLVLGGRGFIGRHIVAALRVAGHSVTVGSRHAARSPEPWPRLQVRLHERLQAEDWYDLIASFDVVVNSVGILRERWRESYEAVYRHGPVALAQACAAHGKRLIHVSALGLRADAGSGFIRQKLAGEQAIRADLGGRPGVCCIVRPSLLDGMGGLGARWMRRVANWPVQFVPMDARGILAPLDVDDLGEAIAALCVCPPAQLPACVEFGGAVDYALPDYLRALRQSPQPAWQWRVPAWVVRLIAHGCDVLHWTPLSWGHVELLRRDNRPQVNDLPRWLGRAPKPIGMRLAMQPVVISSVAVKA